MQDEAFKFQYRSLQTNYRNKSAKKGGSTYTQYRLRWVVEWGTFFKQFWASRSWFPHIKRCFLAFVQEWSQPVLKKQKHTQCYGQNRSLTGGAKRQTFQRSTLLHFVLRFKIALFTFLKLHVQKEPRFDRLLNAVYVLCLCIILSGDIREQEVKGCCVGQLTRGFSFSTRIPNGLRHSYKLYQLRN